MIVLGAGLAGSAVAWHAHWHGWSVAIIDRLNGQTSSRVAAGLVTPITGSRAAASWRWNEFYPKANDFYQSVERSTDASFWRVEPALRVYRSQAESDLYQSKWMTPSQPGLQDSMRAATISDTVPQGLKTPFGLCSLEPAARLDTTTYLDATQRFFSSIGAFHGIDIDCDRDIVVKSSERTYSIELLKLQLQAKRIVFCQGFAARENQYFHDLPLHPARGDILVVSSPNVECTRVIHHDSWAVPIGQSRFLVGATYDRISNEDNVETSAEKLHRFRNELMQRWEAIVPGTFDDGQHSVLEQRWAVRPASYDRHPIIGPHDRFESVYCMNGLGSKGTLMAPRLAAMLIEAMEGAAIEPALLRTRRK